MQPLTTTLTATYTPTSGGFVFWVSGRAVQRAHELSLKDETDTQRIPPSGTPRYAVVSLGMRTRLGDRASLSVAVENVGDVNHRIHGSGVNEAGRSLVLALDLEF
jgi:hemoglobin/transferrin/lactoferrin receptor protein